MIKTILTHIDFLSEQVVALDKEVATRMTEQILAEIGTDIRKQFPSAAHLCFWAGLVPGHNEAAHSIAASKKLSRGYVQTDSCAKR